MDERFEQVTFDDAPIEKRVSRSRVHHARSGSPKRTCVGLAADAVTRGLAESLIFLGCRRRCRRRTWASYSSTSLRRNYSNGETAASRALTDTARWSFCVTTIVRSKIPVVVCVCSCNQFVRSISIKDASTINTIDIFVQLKSLCSIYC